MGYLNPLLHYGKRNSFADARNAGVDGIILPEVPRLAGRVRSFLVARSQASSADILLVSPATTNKRMREIDKFHQDFSIVYRTPELQAVRTSAILNCT